MLGILFMTLWVRSYWRFEELCTQVANSAAVMPVVQSFHGRFWLIWPEDGLGLSWWVISDRPETVYGVSDASQIYRPKDVLGFGVGKGMPGSGFCVPHGFLFVACIGIAALPWIRWSRRFSLRTLLIFTTLVSLLLGLVICLAQI